ncbi:MAG: hypothetical protein RL755_46 [Pseudomonadota bacterium]
MKKVNKDAVLRARVPAKIFDKVNEEAKKQGVLNLSDYVRVAVFEKLARDSGKSITDLLEH